MNAIDADYPATPHVCHSLCKSAHSAVVEDRVEEAQAIHARLESCLAEARCQDSLDCMLKLSTLTQKIWAKKLNRDVI
ncbi:hypothetical protein [Magnetospira sp. QH-2]|uniref:hypothetical protein n=1 Tax=Magnetospira sp. (strain QH-2) TaxID=1288970 RepID=UPI0003E818A7|nr:hypothetical protein [Magnetospira sp. QH-2]CCQ73813.1 Protein of unknown function [Magnetospira sp. QH-2]